MKTQTDLLGTKIRKLRKAQKLKLVELAEKCGISPSFLSQIERNQANPSVTTLYAIAEALETSVIAFFTNGELQPQVGAHESASVVRAHRRKHLLYPGSGIRSEILTPNLTSEIQLQWIVMPPGADSGEMPFVHPGEECGVILQGTLQTWIGSDTYVLRAGDSIYHKSTIPHRSKNISDEDVIMVVAKTSPSF
jgi:transcriptional regulator with XRE-family HTH domain